MAGDLIDEPRAWTSDVNGQHLKTRPSNTIDNPLYVFPINTDGAVAVNDYHEVNSVAKNTETNIFSYTVPVDKTFILRNIEASGDNVATYRVLVAGNEKMKKRSWWSAFNVSLAFIDLEVNSGETIIVKVIHNSVNGVGDFNATLQGLLK